MAALAMFCDTETNLEAGKAAEVRLPRSAALFGTTPRQGRDEEPTHASISTEAFTEPLAASAACALNLETSPSQHAHCTSELHLKQGRPSGLHASLKGGPRSAVCREHP